MTNNIPTLSSSTPKYFSLSGGYSNIRNIKDKIVGTLPSRNVPTASDYRESLTTAGHSPELIESLMAGLADSSFHASSGE